MAHTQYPNSLDLTCAQYVFQTIKDKTIVENKVKFAHCIWSLTGFLLRTVVGIPEDDSHEKTFGDTHGYAASFSHEEKAMLQAICNECSDMMANPITMEDPDPIAGFDISSLISLIPMILQLLQALGISFGGKTASPLEGGHPVED